MAPKFQPGDRVLVEIKGAEIYEGNVVYMSTKSIELYDILCYSTNTKYEGNLTFYKAEVVSVSLITAPSAPKVSPSNNSTTTKKIKMHPDEFHRLKEMTFDYIFVDAFNKRFEDAVEVLRSRDSVAVVGLGNNFVRGKGLSLLLIADFKQVYIFDIYFLVNLEGLKEILESQYISKVVHDGGALYDCLYHKYKVEMKNVFDTKIVDGMISKNDKEDVARNISECLTHHFNFPPSLLSAAVDDLAEYNWADRPVTRSERIKASQLVTYLLPLRDKLMAHILNPYVAKIGEEYGKFKDIRDSDLLKFKKS